MSAPDYATLYNVEDAVEDACAAIWTARATGTPAFVWRDLADLPGQRIDLMLEIGPAFNERENAWTAQLHVRCWSRRDATGRSVNGALRGAVRDCFRRVPAGAVCHPEFTAALLPYHIINRMAAAGTSPQIMVEEDQDMSELHFDMVISVRDGAFPVLVSTFRRPDGTSRFLRPDGASTYIRAA